LFLSAQVQSAIQLEIKYCELFSGGSVSSICADLNLGDLLDSAMDSRINYGKEANAAQAASSPA
jgi:hypothetical protein